MASSIAKRLAPREEADIVYQLKKELEVGDLWCQ